MELPEKDDIWFYLQFLFMCGKKWRDQKGIQWELFFVVFILVVEVKVTILTSTVVLWRSPGSLPGKQSEREQEKRWGNCPSAENSKRNDRYQEEEQASESSEKERDTWEGKGARGLRLDEAWFI